MGNELLIVRSADLQWAPAEEVFGLPGGQEVKVLNRDPETGRIDCLIRFPAGYVEPRHTHRGHHITYVVEGSQRIGDVTLTAGDYLFGPSEKPHGPFHYPDGCLLFGSMWGSTLHEY